MFAVKTSVVNRKMIGRFQKVIFTITKPYILGHLIQNQTTNDKWRNTEACTKKKLNSNLDIRSVLDKIAKRNKENQSVNN